MSTIPSLLKLKDYITLIGTTLGLISLVSACIGTRDAISFGFFLISISIGTDLIDGYIARKTGTVNEMGRELDSLSDCLTFGISPAILTFQAFSSKTGNPYDLFLLIGCILFALGAMLRLARFNIAMDTGYTGVPTPASALLIIAYFYANYFYTVAMGGIGVPFLEVAYYATPFFMILMGWFNITIHITFGEKGKSLYVIFILFAPLCPIFGIIGIFNPNFIVSIVVALFFIISFFSLVGYIFLRLFLNLFKKKKTS
ncbi:MAG: CDP-alcohol phosphatidyltransferase family protein [Promethearchaeota archaeon]|jgi:CDP-diacylglycerol--serine O-phosphatidyltransferase